MRVAILGRTRMLYDTIDMLISAGHDVVLIGTCKEAPEYDIVASDFQKKAEELGIPFFNDAKINSDNNLLLIQSVNADVAISVNWLTVIGESVIKSFKYGILNAHCGDLPRYRGNACPNWAIINGEKEYAITVHFMEPNALDSGNILVQEKYSIEQGINITSIYQKMQERIPNMFVKGISEIEKGNIEGVKQSKENIMRCYPRLPIDSFIDWNLSCENIMKIIRASARPFQGAFFYSNDLKIYVFDAMKENFEEECCVYPGQIIAVNRVNGSVKVAAKDGVICISEIYVNNEKYKASDILDSIRIRLNYCIQDEIYLLKKELIELREQMKEMKLFYKEKIMEDKN